MTDEFQQWRNTNLPGEYQRWLNREGFGRPQVIAVATRDELEQQNADLRAEIAGLRARIEWLQQR